KLSTREMHVLIGRWYDWFVQQHEQSSSVEDWDSRYEQLEDVLEKFGGLSSSEDEETSLRHKALMRSPMAARSAATKSPPVSLNSTPSLRDRLIMRLLRSMIPR